MTKKRSYIKSILSSNSTASSKRVLGMGVGIVIIIIAFVNMFTGKAPAEYVFNGLITVELISFGAIAAENVGTSFKDYKKYQCDSQNLDTSDSTGIPKADL